MPRGPTKMRLSSRGTWSEFLLAMKEEKWEGHEREVSCENNRLREGVRTSGDGGT